MKFTKIERVALARILGDDHEDLDGCDPEDEGRGGGEEAEEAAACCVAAGEDTVEGRTISVKAEDDKDCPKKGLWLETGWDRQTGI